jgi:hypothetical protein
MSTATRVQLHSATQLPSTTSITPCATASFPPAAPALLRLCRASGRAVSPLDFSLVSRTGSRRASGHCVSLRDYSSSGLHRLYYAYVVHPDATSRCSTSRHSVALALAVCPVIPLCVVTTRLAAAMDILHLRRATGCLDTSHGSSSTTSTTPHVRVPRHVARLVTRLVTPLVVDYFDYAARPGASARRAARHAAHRRLLRLRRASGCLSMSRGSSRRAARRVVRRRLRLRHVSGCLGTSRGLSRCSSSTTLPTPRIRVPQHIARLVVDHTSSLHSTSRRSVALALVVRPIAPSRGSTTPCRHSTCCPVTLALLQPRRASRLLVSRQHRLYFEYATRHRDIVFWSHRVDHHLD